MVTKLTWSVGVFVAVSACAGCAHPPAVSPGEQLYRTSRARQHAFEQRLIQEAFGPETPLPRGAERRRMVVSDPYMMMAPVGVEVLRGADRRVLIRFGVRGTSTPYSAAAPSAWTRATAGDALLFRPPPPYRPPPPVTSPPPPPPPICHGFIMRFERADASGARFDSAAQCGLPEAAVLNYAVDLAALGLESRPACGTAGPSGSSVLFQLVRCFSGPRIAPPQ